jgi:hypothetical protein
MPKIKLHPSNLLGFDQAAAMVKIGFKKPSPSPPPPPPARS